MLRYDSPTVVGFSELNLFGIQFNMSNWHMIDFDDTLKDRADVFFQINVQKDKTKKVKSYNYIKQQHKPILVCESNLFRKNSYPITDNRCYYRLGWDHFLRCGNFNNKNSPSDRWKHIQKLQNLQVKDWRTTGDYIVIVLQKPGDSTLNSLYKTYGTYENWIQKTIDQIRKYTNRKIVIRPHLHTTKLNYKQFESIDNNIEISNVFKNRTKIEGGKSLEHDYANAYAVVGYNSNSLVESTLEGIPTFAMSDESVVWDVSNMNKLQLIETPNRNIDRTQWLYDAAYMIWTKEEIANGTAWNHLKGVYFE